MAYRGAQIPRFRPDETPIAARLNTMVEIIERRLADLEGPLVNPRDQAPGEEVYTVSNVTESRTLDASTASAADIAHFVGTLIEDLVAEEKLR